MESTISKDENEDARLIDLNTNQVLVEVTKDKTIYYLPCYIRFKVKDINQIKFDKLVGKLSGTLLFSFYYGNLQKQIVQQFTEEGTKTIMIGLSRQEAIQLKQEKGITFKQDKNNKIIDYVVRCQFQCHLKGDVFYTPFQIINLNLSVTVQTVILDPKLNGGNKIQIKFNCINSDRVTLVDHGQSVQYGYYRLASYFLDCDYRNNAKHRFKPISVLNPDDKIQEAADIQQIQQKVTQMVFIRPQVNDLQHEPSNAQILALGRRSQETRKQISLLKKDNELKIKNFQYAHFRIPLYKYPLSSLLSIFIPLWVLAFINLMIYFQENSFASRLAVIATITLAFIAFLPTINENMPQTSIVKLVQIIIYLQTGATILTIIESYQVKDTSDYIFAWRKDGYFIASFVINALAVGLVATLFILHKLFWENIYLKKRQLKITSKLIKQNWRSRQCDEYFKPFLLSHRVNFLTGEKKLPKLKVSPQKQK